MGKEEANLWPARRRIWRLTSAKLPVLVSSVTLLLYYQVLDE